MPKNLLNKIVGFGLRWLAALLLMLATSQSVMGESLTLYAEANLQGDSKTLTDGHYAGKLDDFNDRAVSFELEPGHIATFADNNDGSGHSRVYIATSKKISINLPPTLQQKVSFVRVGPWQNVRKKSVCAAGKNMFETTNTSWYYDWRSKTPQQDAVQYVPMTWSTGTVDAMQKLGGRMDVSHHLGFNEPDGKKQARMTVERAIEKFKNLQASGLRLGSPAPKDNKAGRQYLDQFMAAALEKNIRVDFLAVHYYKKGQPAAFKRWLEYLDDKYRLPVWITEVNYGAPWNWNAQPAKAYSDGLVAYMQMLDKTPFVERYAIFNWQPPSAFSIYTSKNPEVLSRAGTAYQNHRSPPAYVSANYVPVPWTDNRIGKFYPVSKASYLDKKGHYRIEAAGAGVAGTNDELHFVHQPLVGDGSITAGVKNVSNKSAEVVAGVMMRETQNPQSKYVMLAVTGDRRVVWRSRSTQGQRPETKEIRLANKKKLSGVRLVRKGNQLTAFVSTGDQQWQEVMNDTVTIKQTVSCGLCVSSGKSGSLAVATFENVAFADSKN